MGCGSSRPSSARSWQATEGWLGGGGGDSDSPTHFLPDGRIDVSEAAVVGEAPPPMLPSQVYVQEKDKTGEEGPYEEPANREFGDGMLGVESSRETERQIRELRPGELFQDSTFPPDATSLFFSDRTSAELKATSWMRPSRMVKRPQMLVDGISRDDIMQGTLGDCWLLSSAAAIAQNPKLMSKVVPENELLVGSDYRGAVRVRFWRFGRWVDVWVDDKLPVKDGKILYAHNTDPCEFWVALVEKAYAKLHGSYEAIEGGQAMDALVDLTGGLAERYELSEHTYDLYHKLCRANQTGAFITCSRKGDWKAEHNTVDEFGLIAGHAYTVTSVKRIKRKHGAECLLRIRNPWGMGEEWKGAWADNDDRWNLVDADTKKWLQFVKKDDGEFWMSYKDFVHHFQEVTICTVGPDFDGDGEADEAGKIMCIHGSWEVGASAGGCRNDLHAFASNPQFLLKVHEADQGEEWMSGGSETCSVLVALMQEHRRSQRHCGMRMLQIGFLIYAVEEDKAQYRLDYDHFAYNYESHKSGVYVNFREVVGRFELEPGCYVIIPTTYHRDEPGTFLLRVFAAKSISLKELEAAPEREEASDTPFTMADSPDELVPPVVINTPSPNYPRGLDNDDFDPEIAAAMQR